MVSMDHMPGLRPCRLTRPQVGLRHHPAPGGGPPHGPPVSLPREAGIQAGGGPSGTTAGTASEALQVPGVPRGGERVGQLVVPNSVISSLPRRMAPAAFSLAITVASSAGTTSLKMGVP